MLNRLSKADVDAVLREGSAHILHRDYETRSTCVLKSAGAYRYAADRRTEVLCCGYAVDDSPVQLWTPGDPVPPEFIEAAHNPAWIVVAHNDQFEAAIEQFLLAARPSTISRRQSLPLPPATMRICAASTRGRLVWLATVLAQ